MVEADMQGRLGFVIVLVTFGLLLLRSATVRKRGGWKTHGTIGLSIATISTVLTFFHLEPVATYHSAIVWSGYILFADAMAFLLRGESFLCTYRGGLPYLLFIAFPIYAVFEVYNTLTLGWEYHYATSHPLWRFILFSWGWIQVVPSLVVTAWWLDTFKLFQNDEHPAITITSGLVMFIAALGFVMIVTPFMVERETMVGLSPPLGSLLYYSFMFIGPACVFDTINYWRGKRSFLRDLEGGHWEPLLTFSVTGVVCGFLWEGWNYPATGRWIYPLLPFPEYKAFELPLPFYLYYMPFTIACMTMVECVTPRWLSSFRGLWAERRNV